MQLQSKPQLVKSSGWRRWLLVSVFILFVCANGIGLFFGNKVYEEASILQPQMHMPKSTAKQQMLDLGKKENQWQDVVIESRYGYSLTGTYIPNPHATDKTLIFLHGFTDNRLAGLNYARIYLDSGFNLLIVDSRAHGESGGESVTWGVYEKYDLDQWVDWVRQRFPTGQIGIHGVSMGAATAVLHAGINEPNKRVAFYIADSSYTDFDSLLKLQLHQKFPQIEPVFWDLLLPYANLAAYYHGRFTFYQSSPIQAARQITTPILYLHGDADEVIPVSMSLQLYQATLGPRQIYIFPQVGHIQAVYRERQRYDQVIQTFIHSI